MFKTIGHKAEEESSQLRSKSHLPTANTFHDPNANDMASFKRKAYETFRRIGKKIKEKTIQFKGELASPATSSTIGAAAGMGVTTGITALSGPVGFAAGSVVSTLVVPIVTKAASKAATIIAKDGIKHLLELFQKHLQENQK